MIALPQHFFYPSLMGCFLPDLLLSFRAYLKVTKSASLTDDVLRPKEGCFIDTYSNSDPIGECSMGLMWDVCAHRLLCLY